MRPIKEGDEFYCKCGEVVTVQRYVDSSNVEVADNEGNRRTVDSFSLRDGIRWRKRDGSLFKVNKKLKTPAPDGHYVYIVTVSGEVVYVGCGKGDRYRHTISGQSSNKELNRLYFSSAPMITEVWANSLTRKAALKLEKVLIAEHRPKCNVYKT